MMRLGCQEEVVLATSQASHERSRRAPPLYGLSLFDGTHVVHVKMASCVFDQDKRSGGARVKRVLQETPNRWGQRLRSRSMSQPHSGFLTPPHALRVHCRFSCLSRRSLHGRSSESSDTAVVELCGVGGRMFAGWMPRPKTLTMVQGAGRRHVVDLPLVAVQPGAPLAVAERSFTCLCFSAATDNRRFPVLCMCRRSCSRTIKADVALECLCQVSSMRSWQMEVRLDGVVDAAGSQS